jgi:hypothetical protein
VKEQIAAEAAAEVAENIVKSRELGGWQQPVTRARPEAGPPGEVLKINRANKKKARRAKTKRQKKTDPHLQELLGCLVKDPL